MTPETIRTYCDECCYLQLRPVKAEVPAFSGNYVVTGTRYYCPKWDRWYPLNTRPEDIRFSYCDGGLKK